MVPLAVSRCAQNILFWFLDHASGALGVILQSRCNYHIIIILFRFSAGIMLRACRTRGEIFCAVMT